MKFYWKANSIPEVAALPQAERRQVLRECKWKVFRNWQVWLAMVGLFICVAIGCAIGDWLAPSHVKVSPASTETRFNWPDRTLYYLCAGIGGAIGGAMFGQVQTHQMRPYLRACLDKARN
jgi:predicted MFS family arabinose efflux permease